MTAATEERRWQRARAAKATAAAEYEQANAEYQAALRAATGPGGGFDPRSPEAQHAETLRVEMLRARSARDYAHSAWMGEATRQRRSLLS